MLPRNMMMMTNFVAGEEKARFRFRPIVDAGGFMSCQHDRTRGILHNGHALAFHCASFGFFPI
jgi:hypothetical protein